jgi:hypothetical protein
LVLITDSLAPERLVKSGNRVRDIGEVFTPNATIQAMLNLLPDEIWAVHPSPPFLEPACGDGNFLVAILDRKLERIAQEYVDEKLPAGNTPAAALFHALEALASIYGVDISIDNVIGGTPGHEVGARSRLVRMIADWSSSNLNMPIVVNGGALRSAQWVVEHNVLLGNMLARDAIGQPTGRDRLPLIEYTFEPSTRSVGLMKTTMGDVLATEEAKTSSMMSLFNPPAPASLWQGDAFNLAEASRVEAPKLRGPARNGNGRRS